MLNRLVLLLLIIENSVRGEMFRSLCTTANSTTLPIEIDVNKTSSGLLLSHAFESEHVEETTDDYDEHLEIVKMSPENFGCLWRLKQNGETRQIVLNFEKFDFSEDDNCSDTYVKVRSEHDIGTFCGSTKPMPVDVISTSEELSIEVLVSKRIRGFKIRFSTESESETFIARMALHETITTEPELITTRKPQPIIEPACTRQGAILIAPSGKINEPPQNATALECTWIIDPKPNQANLTQSRIDLQFFSFSFDDGQNCSIPAIEIVYTDDSGLEQRFEFSACDWPNTDRAYSLQTSRSIQLLLRKDELKRNHTFEVFYKAYGIQHEEVPKAKADFGDENDVEDDVEVSCGESFAKIASFHDFSAESWIPSNAGSWPWAAELVYRPTNFRCMATIIDRKWLLTVAHCFSKGRNVKSQWMVIVHPFAFKNRTSEVNKMGPLTPKINNLLVHPSYMKNPRAGNDIALVQLAESIRFGQSTARAVCLPERDPTEAYYCLTTSWDLTSNTGLIEMAQPIIDNSQCASNPYLARVSDVSDDMICVGHSSNSEAQSNVCQGVLGSSFVCYIGGIWELHGLHSVSSCVDGFGTPGLYTKVSRFNGKWIKQVIAKFKD